jgi:hypothetical protein
MYSSLLRHFRPTLIFAGKADFPSGALAVHHSKGWLIAYPTNIRKKSSCPEQIKFITEGYFVKHMKIQ